ncbi:MAG: mechanosensitive ion channel [Eubacteriales bacterium]|nr:mechanosensitive ion channel [Clostridiales bacterium]MDY5836977.1 mechanosensitive ion channel [Eubacteriales bacterium]
MNYSVWLETEKLAETVTETAADLLQHKLWEETSSLDLGISLVVLLVAWFLRKLPGRLFARIFKRQPQLEEQIQANLPQAFLLPLLTWIGLNRWVLTFPPSLHAFLARLNASLLIFVLVRSGLACLRSVMQVKVLGENKWQLKQASISFYFRLIQVITWLLTVLAILSIFGVNVASLTAGLGLGGLAISLAAQDSLSNLIAGFVLLNDPDLKVGDDIEILGQSGTLVDLGLRSSQIRAYDRSLITIPNKLLSENILLNISRMDKRRILFRLRLPITATSEDIAQVRTQTLAYLRTRDQVDPEDLYCNLDGITDTGTELYIRFYILDPSWALMMQEKEALLEFLWDLLLTRHLAEPKQGLRIELLANELQGLQPAGQGQKTKLSSANFKDPR